MLLSFSIDISMSLALFPVIPPIYIHLFIAVVLVVAGFFCVYVHKAISTIPTPSSNVYLRHSSNTLMPRVSSFAIYSVSVDWIYSYPSVGIIVKREQYARLYLIPSQTVPYMASLLAMCTIRLVCCSGFYELGDLLINYSPNELNTQLGSMNWKATDSKWTRDTNLQRWAGKIEAEEWMRAIRLERNSIDDWHGRDDRRVIDWNITRFIEYFVRAALTSFILAIDRQLASKIQTVTSATYCCCVLPTDIVSNITRARALM